MKRCELCFKGFPRKDGQHVPSQRLGMIPVTWCTAISPKTRVIERFPSAKAVKVSISNWGVLIETTGRWLSYGEARPHLAWLKAATTKQPPYVGELYT